jgi:hypothetical protein
MGSLHLQDLSQASAGVAHVDCARQLLHGSLKPVQTVTHCATSTFGSHTLALAQMSLQLVTFTQVPGPLSAPFWHAWFAAQLSSLRQPLSHRRSTGSAQYWPAWQNSAVPSMPFPHAVFPRTVPASGEAPLPLLELPLELPPLELPLLELVEDDESLQPTTRTREVTNATDFISHTSRMQLRETPDTRA